MTNSIIMWAPLSANWACFTINSAFLFEYNWNHVEVTQYHIHEQLLSHDIMWAVMWAAMWAGTNNIMQAVIWVDGSYDAMWICKAYSSFVPRLSIPVSVSHLWRKDLRKVWELGIWTRYSTTVTPLEALAALCSPVSCLSLGYPTNVLVNDKHSMASLWHHSDTTWHVSPPGYPTELCQKAVSQTNLRQKAWVRG